MACRFTITDKWADKWYRKLSIEGKVLFQYLCDNCDIAGFWEIDLEVAAVKTRIPFEKETGLLDNCKTHYQDISTVMQELTKCYITNEKYLWIKNFIYYQGNLPLHKNCNTNTGIIKSINSHNSLKEKVLGYLKQQEIDKGLTTLVEGLDNPSSNGNSNGKGKEGIVKGGIKKPSKKEYIYTDEFETFWKAFKGRWNPDTSRFEKGGKQEAFEEWTKLKPEQQNLALLAAPKTGSKITKDACRWLKYHRWEDFETTSLPAKKPANKKPVDDFEPLTPEQKKQIRKEIQAVSGKDRRVAVNG